VPRTLPPLVARPLVDLAPALAGCDDPGFGVDAQGAVYAVAARDGETLLVRWEAGAPLRTLRLAGERVVYRFVQPLADGFVLAAARCRWRKDGPETNALVLDGDGHVRARLTLGDGIADLRVAPDGTLWVSYFDEGVFGNRGWNGPGPEPFGATGLNAFSATGERRFAYRPEAASTDAICDCYALNVGADGDAWIYFYDEFPIVRVHGARYHVWHTNVSGAAALAVHGKRALLLGDYDRRDRARLLELGARGSATVTAVRPLVDATGAAFAPELARGVGRDLYCFHARAVSVVSDW
jgi:hypothetical protein